MHDSAREAPPRGTGAGGGETGVLGRFFLLSYVLLLANGSRFLLESRGQGAAAAAFLAAALLTYGALYLLPALLPALLLHAALGRGPGARLLARLRVPPSLPARTAAVLLAGAVQFLLHADLTLYRMYGFHMNGFVWNLLRTPGGIESLGADASSTATAALFAAGFLAAEGLLLLAALRWRGLSRSWERRARLRPALAAAGIGLLLSAGERIAYGFSDVYDYRPVLRSAAVLPFYSPVRFRNFARDTLGIDAARTRREIAAIRPGKGTLRYPLSPVEAPADAPRWNVVWLVAESLRSDMLDPEVMPATSAFAARNADFRNHFSGGNGTRMGMFSMFYGLYGPYWTSFLQERRDPVLVDFLLDRGYDLEAFTSARFTFPEMDRTVFARFAGDRLHEGDPGLPGWENDRRQVAALLGSVDRCAADRPFFRFLFFESPHARYTFPEECAIRRPYLEKVDYAAMDAARDHDLLKNRYVNACRHLDTQFDRVFRGLEERGLMDRTIVVVTGDHGEEFMERGRWGHHSAFNRFQTQVPLVLHAPGKAPLRVERMTGHDDLPATVLGLLGVTTPPSEYGLGEDLLAGPGDGTCVITGVDDMAEKDAAGTIVSPLGGAGLARSEFFGPDDVELPPEAEDAALRASGDRIRIVLAGLARFRR